MPKPLIACLLLLSLSWAGVPRSNAADNDGPFPYPVIEETLDNGLRVVMIPMDTPDIVSYYSVVRTGSRDEWEPGKSGFAHFFEHMMFRGTKKFPGPVYDEIMNRIGADSNANTSFDRTIYHQTFCVEDLETVVELEADRFRNLDFSPQQFRTEAGAVHGEYKKGVTNPWSVGSERMHDMAFDAHTYKHTVIGFERDIVDYPNLYEYSKTFFDRYYRPENVILVIVGDFDRDETMRLIRKYYGGWRPGYVAPKICPEPPQTASREQEVSFAGRTLPILMVAYKGDAFDADDKNVLAVSLLGELAFGPTSDLYKKLVLDEQKVEFISASFGYSRDPGLVQISTRIKDEAGIEYVKSEIARTLEAYKRTLCDPQKLDDLKRRRKYSFLMGLDSTNSVASAVGRYLSLTGDVGSINQLQRNMQTITPEDIRNAANRYFVTAKKNTIVVKGAAQ